ncbi:MAG TPA: cysteine peptidase family C39 domain-containing protein [Candidatus Binatia bacterium]
MNPVVQDERTGCGIASVAALAGVSYARAKAQAARLGISAENPKLWSDTECVRTLLGKFGLSTSGKQRKFHSWERLPDLALLAIKWHLEKGKPYWHWVVFVREEESHYVLDPKKTLKKNKRTDFGRMKPKWFIEVYA